MIFVVEIYRTGANVFKSGANFITYDEPDPERLGEAVFYSINEAKAAYQRGAAIFADYGPVGYRAFLQFEGFLQDQNVIPKPANAPRKKKGTTPRSKPDWG